MVTFCVKIHGAEYRRRVLMKTLILDMRLVPETYTAAVGLAIMITGIILGTFPVFIIGTAVGLTSWIVGTGRNIKLKRNKV